MKVLLDACVPRPLRKLLPDHTVHTAQEMGWGQLTNGALLRAAETQFDALITFTYCMTTEALKAFLSANMFFLIASR